LQFTAAKIPTVSKAPRLPDAPSETQTDEAVMISQLRIKSIAHVSLAALMLAAVACDSATSPIANDAPAAESAQFGKTPSSPAATSILIFVASNVSVGQNVDVGAQIWTDGHTLGGKKVSLSVDGGPAMTAQVTRSATREWTLSGLSAGTHSLVARFSGDDSYASSSASATVTVNP
jgi:hypothetical protein